MAHVNVTIAGKTYRMACEEGEEERLTALAARFDRTVEDLRERIGEIGDRRLAVMAGLLVIDDLDEAEQRLEQAEAEVAQLTAEVERLEAAAGTATERATAAPTTESAEAAEKRREKLRQAVDTIDEITRELTAAGRRGG
jgi:cell division protein ZapA